MSTRGHRSSRSLKRSTSLRKSARQLLTREECETFKEALRAFRERSTPEQLSENLIKILNTPDKQNLLLEISLLLPPEQRDAFIKASHVNFPDFREIPHILIDVTEDHKKHNDVNRHDMHAGHSHRRSVTPKRATFSAKSVKSLSFDADLKKLEHTDPQNKIQLEQSAPIRRLHDDMSVKVIKLAAATFSARYKLNPDRSLLEDFESRAHSSLPVGRQKQITTIKEESPPSEENGQFHTNQEEEKKDVTNDAEDLVERIKMQINKPRAPLASLHDKGFWSMHSPKRNLEETRKKEKSEHIHAELMHEQLSVPMHSFPPLSQNHSDTTHKSQHETELHFVPDDCSQGMADVITDIADSEVTPNFSSDTDGDSAESRNRYAPSSTSTISTEVHLTDTHSTRVSSQQDGSSSTLRISEGKNSLENSPVKEAALQVPNAHSPGTAQQQQSALASNIPGKEVAGKDKTEPPPSTNESYRLHTKAANTEFSEATCEPEAELEAPTRQHRTSSEPNSATPPSPLHQSRDDAQERQVYDHEDDDRTSCTEEFTIEATRTERIESEPSLKNEASIVEEGRDISIDSFDDIPDLEITRDHLEVDSSIADVDQAVYKLLYSPTVKTADDQASETSSVLEGDFLTTHNLMRPREFKPTAQHAKTVQHDAFAQTEEGLSLFSREERTSRDFSQQTVMPEHSLADDEIHGRPTSIPREEKLTQYSYSPDCQDSSTSPLMETSPQTHMNKSSYEMINHDTQTSPPPCQEHSSTSPIREIEGNELHRSPHAVPTHTKTSSAPVDQFLPQQLPSQPPMGFFFIPTPASQNAQYPGQFDFLNWMTSQMASSQARCPQNPEPMQKEPDRRRTVVLCKRDRSFGFAITDKHMGEKKGIFITTVVSDSPAADQGLQPGDEILAIEGEDIRNMTLNQVGMAIKFQDKITLRIYSHVVSPL